MRKVYGVAQLISYLASVNVILTEEEIHDYVLKKDIPHQRPIRSMIVFNLDHIDWWVHERGLKP